MKFKKSLSVLILLITAINIIAPSYVFASHRFTIYNCGEQVDTIIADSVNEIYIDSDDLHWYNLKYDEMSDHLCLYTKSREIKIFRNSNIVEVDGVNMTYYNAVTEKNGREYISLSFIAMLFSQIYEVTENDINLWISYYPDTYAKGIISLADGQPAPEGGIDVTVSAYKQTATATGGMISTNLGYDGVYRYEKNYFDISQKTITEKTVTIPHGSNSVGYFLCDEDGFGTSAYIACFVDSNGYSDSERLSFSYKEEKLYNFTIGRRKIKGKVILSEPSEHDTEICIVADGVNDFEKYATIPAGETTYEYETGVSDGEYNVRVFFAGNTYMRTTYPGKVSVNGTDAMEINLYCEPSEVNKVIISLPEGMETEETINGYIFLQSANEPYYYIDTASFKIKPGETIAEAELINDYGYGDLICFYELKNKSEELWDFGYYNSSGMVTELDDAQIFAGERLLNFQLVKESDVCQESSPLPLKLYTSNIYENMGKIKVENSSAYDVKDFSLYIAIYDSTGKLVGLESQKVECIPADKTEIVETDVSGELVKKSDIVKVFAWSDNSKPLSESVYLKEKAVVALGIKADSNVIISYGKESALESQATMFNGTLLCPLRAFGESLGLGVYWDESNKAATFIKGTEVVTITVDNYVALHNNVHFKLSEPMRIYVDVVYVPAMDIAERFGYDTEFKSDTRELFIYDRGL